MSGPTSEVLMPGEVRLGQYAFNEATNLSKTGGITDVYPTRRIGEKESRLVLRRAKFGQDNVLADEINIRTSLSSDPYLREHMPKMVGSGEHGLRPYILVERINEEDLLPVLEVAQNLSSEQKKDVANQIVTIVEHWHINNYLINDLGNGDPLKAPLNKADRYILIKKGSSKKLNVVDLDANLGKKIVPFKEINFSNEEKNKVIEFRRNISAVKFLNSAKGQTEILRMCQEIGKYGPESKAEDIEKLKEKLEVFESDVFLANGIIPEKIIVDQLAQFFSMDDSDSLIKLRQISELLISSKGDNFVNVFKKIRSTKTNWTGFAPIFNSSELSTYIQDDIFQFKANLYQAHFPGRERNRPQTDKKTPWKNSPSEILELINTAENELRQIDNVTIEIKEENKSRANGILNEYQCVLTILEKLLGEESESQILGLRTELTKLPKTKDLHSQAALLIRKRLKLLI